MTVSILVGDCRARLRELEAGSAHTCVTSPPYFGLRDYGHAGQIGLEDTPDQFVAEMVDVFREVRRVLRDDGTLWLNLGDSYAGSWGAQGHRVTDSDEASWHGSQIKNHPKRRRQTGTIRQAGLKPKDLIGIPWMVAFALRADGWYLRQDIIWHKPNPMPESVTDRCTKAHEYVFLLSKGPRYYFDADAIAEPIQTDPKERYEERARITGRGEQGAAAARGDDRDKSGGFPPKARGKGNAKTFRGGGAYTQGQSFDNSAAVARDSHGNKPNETGLRNKRSVWTVGTKPFPEAHFATYPPDLIEPCILAGAPRGGLVLDPFGGAGTTGLVADRLGRDATLIELNPEYAEIARRRISGDAGMFGTVEVAA